ncbi:hypothetical protein EVAR_8605_1 [Eumeta japonica]|uniref:Uncharacterized protein n=1 Tax=Eumeta variegata TaxID=151549 RepID=A0A4C1XEF7_EUMVA|nr:hypothetical protein EVAR_8605_1 [Eumeta japonica]
MDTPLPFFPGDLFIAPAALHKIVMRFPKKKAPGPDGISTAALRHLPRRAIVAMYYSVQVTSQRRGRGRKSLRFRKRKRIHENRRTFGLSPCYSTWLRHLSVLC